MSGSVYVVLAIDTEGPVSDPRLPELLTTWNEVDTRFLSKVFSHEYRSRYPDSGGQPMVFSWFILHWVGFSSNPVHRDLGYHKVYDHYTRVWGEAMRRYGDGVYWHYHRPPTSGVANEWNRDWLSNTEYESILCRTMLDRGYFPSVFRAGGTIETSETSHWLEQWIPFDFSNRAGNVNWDKLEADGSRLRDVADWSRAPDDWSPYHPDPNDYQRPGGMKRTIFRSLDILSGAHTLTQEEVDTAFTRAGTGHSTILSLFEHDSRDRTQEIEELALRPIAAAARRFPEVSWYYVNALVAAQAVTGCCAGPGPTFAARYEDEKLIIATDRPLVGLQPFVAVRHPNGLVERQDMQQSGEHGWIGPMIPADGGEVGIASSDLCGNVGVGCFRRCHNELVMWDGERRRKEKPAQ